MTKAFLFVSAALVLFLSTDHRRQAVAAAPPEEKPKKPAITPQVEKITLTIDGRDLKPVRTKSPWQLEYVAGEQHIILDGKKLQATGGAKKWTVEAPDGHRLYWLAADRAIAYLGGYQFDPKTEDEKLDSPSRVRRLDLSSGKWLADLQIGAKEKLPPKQTESVLSVLPDEKHVVVLSVTVRDEKGDKTVQSYRVTCLKNGAVKPLWSKSFPSAGEKSRPGVYLLSAARRPNSASSDLQYLSWLGDAILVCAGSVQDIICLERATGKQRWQLERVWEYQRGFIGPSVWQHYIGRCRLHPFLDEKDDKQKAASKEFAKRYQCELMAGPVVVPLPKRQGKDAGHRIFVAVSKAPLMVFADYLADCVVYELSDDGGKPVAMANVPRLIQGGQFRVRSDGVVWACQENAFAKFAPSRFRGLEIGPGGPDLIARIAWYRQTKVEETEAWLVSDKAGDPVAFDEARAFRLPAGGYVVDEAKYCFPMSLVDLKTGLDRTLTLRVPYKGKIPKPETNYSEITLPGGKTGWHTKGPYVLAITQLRIEGKRLRVTLGMENWSAVLDFDMDELLKPKKE